MSLVTLYIADTSLSHFRLFSFSHLTCFSLLVNIRKCAQALCAFVSVVSIFLSPPWISELSEEAISFIFLQDWTQRVSYHQLILITTPFLVEPSNKLSSQCERLSKMCQVHLLMISFPERGQLMGWALSLLCWCLMAAFHAHLSVFYLPLLQLFTCLMLWAAKQRSVMTLWVCVLGNLTTFQIVPRKGRNPSSCKKAEIGHGEFLCTGDFYLTSVSYCIIEKSQLCHILSHYRIDI